jgi:hypothetical protein
MCTSGLVLPAVVTATLGQSQQVSVSGFAIRNGIALSETDNHSERLPWTQMSIPGGSLATFYDSPGVITTNTLGTVSTAVVVFNFAFQASIDSGGQHQDCPLVLWQAYEIWQNGVNVAGNVYVIQP